MSVVKKKHVQGDQTTKNEYESHVVVRLRVSLSLGK